MIHLGKIKKNSSIRKNLRIATKKSSSKFLLLPNFENLQKNKIFLICGFVFITFLLLSSVSIISQNSSFDARATNNEARLITNFYYNSNKDGAVEAKPID